jgi:hypothetical protein
MMMMAAAAAASKQAALNKYECAKYITIITINMPNSTRPCPKKLKNCDQQMIHEYFSVNVNTHTSLMAGRIMKKKKKLIIYCGSMERLPA